MFAKLGHFLENHKRYKLEKCFADQGKWTPDFSRFEPGSKKYRKLYLRRKKQEIEELVEYEKKIDYERYLIVQEKWNPNKSKLSGSSFVDCLNQALMCSNNYQQYIKMQLEELINKKFKHEQEEIIKKKWIPNYSFFFNQIIPRSSTAGLFVN